MIIEIEKLNLNFNITGNVMKNTKEGMVIIIVLYDKLIIFSVSLDSQNIQIKAKIDVNGMEIIIAASSEDLLATSETIIIIIAVNIVFESR